MIFDCLGKSTYCSYCAIVLNRQLAAAEIFGAPFAPHNVDATLFSPSHFLSFSLLILYYSPSLLWHLVHFITPDHPSLVGTL